MAGTGTAGRAGTLRVMETEASNPALGLWLMLYATFVPSLLKKTLLRLTGVRFPNRLLVQATEAHSAATRKTANKKNAAYGVPSFESKMSRFVRLVIVQRSIGTYSFHDKAKVLNPFAFEKLSVHRLLDSSLNHVDLYRRRVYAVHNFLVTLPSFGWVWSRPSNRRQNLFCTSDQEP